MRYWVQYLTYYREFQSQYGIFVVTLMDLLPPQYTFDHEKHFLAIPVVLRYWKMYLQMKWMYFGYC